jgi:hypothetical protein
MPNARLRELLTISGYLARQTIPKTITSPNAPKAGNSGKKRTLTQKQRQAQLLVLLVAFNLLDHINFNHAYS